MLIIWLYLKLGLDMMRGHLISLSKLCSIQLDLFLLQIFTITQAKGTPLGSVGFSCWKIFLSFWLVAGEWSEPKERHTWAGGCSAEESWTDCDHHSSVQAWRWGHIVSYHTWICHDVVFWAHSFDGLNWKKLSKVFLSQIRLLGTHNFAVCALSPPSSNLYL